jgi:hypothetical protein
MSYYNCQKVLNIDLLGPVPCHYIVRCVVYIWYAECDSVSPSETREVCPHGVKSAQWQMTMIFDSEPSGWYKTVQREKRFFLVNG